MAYDPSCLKTGDKTECKNCGQEIELFDGSVMGWYWAHTQIPEGREFGFTACDYDNPLSWMRGDAFSARPKEETDGRS